MAVIFRLNRLQNRIKLSLSTSVVTCALLAGCQSTQSAAPQWTVSPQAESTYVNLVEQAKSQQVSDISQWQKLRDSYSQTGRELKHYKTIYDYTPLVLQALNAQDFKGCIKNAERILAVNYTHLTAHFGAMNCHRALAHEPESYHHQLMLNHLMDAIAHETNGRSYEFAFKAYSFDDIQSLVYLFGLTIRDRQFVTHNDRHYDKVSVTESDINENFDLYFDVTNILYLVDQYKGQRSTQ
ncbi:hypothetical protein C2869_16075 [Saccharobesus litoralis]|uniref:DUF4919 domain-containing protein n=1 Tax=Saccharobesus litoralis TaxID=2172099 RepID=A0A2S0VUG1_9ALTE|nr:DUF4919 domain-containing protein [Saccharobesus litoralis]AWB67849.1 hypothetical protein C2869_16075 [Saccharobesus litoralis]